MMCSDCTMRCPNASLNLGRCARVMFIHPPRRPLRYGTSAWSSPMRILPSTIVPSRMTRCTRRGCAWRMREREGAVTGWSWCGTPRDAIKWHRQQQHIHGNRDDRILRDRRHTVAHPVRDVDEVVLAERLQRGDAHAENRTAGDEPGREEHAGPRVAGVGLLAGRGGAALHEPAYDPAHEDRRPRGDREV